MARKKKKNSREVIDYPENLMVPDQVTATYVKNEPLQDMEPDWSEIWSIEDAESELGIKFRGLGWYHNKGDTLLVLPYGTAGGTKFEQTYSADTRLYKFYVYNSRNPAETFNWIVNAPVRT